MNEGGKKMYKSAVCILVGVFMFCSSGCHAKKPVAPSQKEAQTKTIPPEEQGTPNYPHAAPLPLPLLSSNTNSNIGSTQTSSQQETWNNVASMFGVAVEMCEAARTGDLEQVKTLLARNPNLANAKDNYGLTPLHYAASNGHKDIAELLLAKGADVNARDNHGETPLDSAVFFDYNYIATLLRQHGGIGARFH